MKGKSLKADSNWTLIAIVSVLCAVFLLAGAALALSRSLDGSHTATHNQKVNQPSQPPNTHSITIFAMGDSLTRGFKDENNLGYVGNVQQGIEKRGQKVSVNNVAINGYVSTQLVQQLKDPTVLMQIHDASIIAFSIGGNDLVHTVHNYTLPTLEQTRPAEQTFLKNLNTILQTLRAQNKHAPIRMVGLYNPFLQFEGGAAGPAIVEDWNAKTSSLLRSYTDALLVPTMDVFTANGDAFLADDHFHPNGNGYQAIADRMLQDLPSAKQ